MSRMQEVAEAGLVESLLAWAPDYGLGFVAVLILGAILGAVLYILWIEVQR